MNDPLKDWGELQTEWQAYQPDMQKIRKKINWVTWRMRAILFFDVLILISYVPFMSYILVDKDVSRIEFALYVVMGGALLYGVYLDFKIRLPIFRAQSESTKDILELYLNRIKAGIKLARISYYCCLFLYLVFWVFFLSKYFFSPAVDSNNMWWRFLFVNLWLTVLVIISLWYQKKKEKEHKRLNELWKELLD